MALLPCRSLESYLVTIKGYMEEPEFVAALRRQLDALEVSDSATVEVGARRVLRIKQQSIIGFKVCLDQLSDDESLRIQATGLGGRRRLGCGLFNSIQRANLQEGDR
jgi:CRISPR-associated endonuclease/helicase Cas3